jgi:hypothetical protein
MVEARVKLESTESFTKMAKEYPYYAERFALVESPDQFYTLRAYIDLYDLSSGCIRQMQLTNNYGPDGLLELGQ